MARTLRYTNAVGSPARRAEAQSGRAFGDRCPVYAGSGPSVPGLVLGVNGPRCAAKESER